MLINIIIHHPLFYLLVAILIIEAVVYFVRMFLPEKKVKKEKVYIVHTSKIGAKFGEWRNK